MKDGGFPAWLAALKDAWQTSGFPTGSAQHTRLRFLAHYGLAVVTVAAALGLRLVLTSWAGPGLATYITFYPAIMVTALFGGFWPGLVATALSDVAVGYWVVPPVGELSIASPIDRLGMMIFTGMGIYMSVVAALYRRNRDKIAAYNRAAALRESQVRLAAFAAASFEGIVESEAGRIVDCNEQFARMLGYSVAELRGMEIARLIPPEDRGRVMANILLGRESIIEQIVARKDGTPIVLEAHGRSLFPGSAKRHTAIRDITDRKQAEEQLTAAKESAERAKSAAEQANHAKDHFLAVLSHELRTPLTPVVLGVSLLEDSPNLDAKARDTLAMIRSNVAMEARLIDDLLDVTRIERGKIELSRTPLELCVVIQRAVEVCMPDIDARQVHFGMDLGPNPPYWVDADASRLQQVFWNLLKNAIKFTPRGGCIGIRVRPNATHVVAEVIDSGIGIDPASLSRVFNAFEQAERSITREFGGLGLGLAISRALVELHGGEIHAHSQGRNTGATFRVRLPLSAPAGQARAISVVPARARPLRILLVEDHGVSAHMIRTVLQERGHTVTIAGDVGAALELAGQESFELLISDLGLPDGTGHELLVELRRRGCMFPAIALSGYGQEDDIRRSHHAGFAAHLTKPASREAIDAAVASVIIQE